MGRALGAPAGMKGVGPPVNTDRRVDAARVVRRPGRVSFRRAAPSHARSRRLFRPAVNSWN